MTFQNTKFKINERIVLKLENDKTNIYVNDELFNQCKYLLLNLSTKDFEKFDKIDSINEAFKIYNNMEDRKNETNKQIIDPYTEFVGHCSNLQVWAENGYDLRILHSSLSFPLLKKLATSGDKTALMRLKEEIAQRIEKGTENTLIYFLNEEYLHLFEIEELETIWEKINITNQELLRKVNKLMNLKRITDGLKKKGKVTIKVNYDKVIKCTNEEDEEDEYF